VCAIQLSIGIVRSKFIFRHYFKINEILIHAICYTIFQMTMNCPLCGSLMVWLNGSISHDRPVKQYQCRVCNIFVYKQLDDSYQIEEIKYQK